LGGATAMSREAILGNIRRSLKRQRPADPPALEARLASPLEGPIPARGQIPRLARIELFLDMTRRAAATVARVDNLDEVPGAVAEYLAGENLPARVKLAPDPRLQGLPWGNRPLIEISAGRSHGDDAVSLCRAEAGIAETGTLLLASGPESPTTLNFLPDTEIVLLPADAVVGGMEEAWRILRGRFPHQSLPRTVNLITGPSRSADIGLKLQLGAHGPRRLHILLVGE
jgi:L-lactate dehydrogenase complex protein LldG